MTDASKLAAVRLVHTIIYVAMALSTFALVYAGLSGNMGPWLMVPLTLLAIEVVVFVGNGFKCPLTALAVRYGAVRGYAFDTYFPESVMRHTFWFFTSLMVLGLVLLGLRWAGLIGG
ncbi:hypothetical protein [Devosia sp. 63-57]|uniref:hypothetical protein n=1 Tax=Devosia sp. 63-57 TaxID=1895751 RepID=UPI00086EA889|nr:hypothetical protein [Devosia sp. 63-57]ODT51216.1 MAG: hypothetical protein ABS74_00610 [Pelagibacterium sp. SCN 63-126]ODU84173.1 MAG: hypothetical protein ABT14_15095 [Pelagibacterium sp. SCN 63-17]OJX41680.1 MAG: hypothetical protein BGO80_08745 [Devosia sp. 63-57]